MRISYSLLVGLCAMMPFGFKTLLAQPLDLSLRYQTETELHSGRFHRLTRSEAWKPEETAVIVCDVWDLHHCLNAVRRAEEFAPRLDQVVSELRTRGVTVIHSPSSCMAAYEGHPARQRAQSAPTADFIPHECDQWCSLIPAEERAVYPIDQSDGGEDDDPQEHEAWAAKLSSMGRNPRAPWKKQSDLISINSEVDYISDDGVEVWNVLQDQGIRNVILTGVHTNMCVLGRPFGLRQMSRNGMNVVLVRDMTDTMYNPARWPWVSHFTGTDLIVSHIERYVCPTITSDQIIGGRPFRFQHDQRPHLVMLIAEREYKTRVTLPAFAQNHLGREFRVTTVFDNASDRDDLPGISVVEDADVLLVSVRRRVLPPDQLKFVRDHVAAGKPVIGIRTASHAFSLRNRQPQEGHEAWPEFDAEVFGGNYHGHHGNALTSAVEVTNAEHPITKGLSPRTIPQGYSLYETSPLANGTEVLTTGTIEGKPSEPVSWTFQRANGGRSFYTSMGHEDDFRQTRFTQLLYRGICWTAGVTPSETPSREEWSRHMVPPSIVSMDLSSAQHVWMRCAFRLPADWSGSEQTVELQLPGQTGQIGAWVNGRDLDTETSSGNQIRYSVSVTSLEASDPNLLVVRGTPQWFAKLKSAPVIQCGERTLPLSGYWQVRQGRGEDYSAIPLPARFGASADILFSPAEPLWTARPLTQPNAFTPGIEGPACDAAGNIFAVNFDRQGTIGRVSPDGSAEVFVTLPEGSTGNGIRFDRDGSFFVADYSGHNVLRVNAATREVSVVAHNDQMNQPNDLAIAPDGTLYASDPAWQHGTGQLWRIDQDGTTTRLAGDMGTTNGVEVSPDGRTLYVNESVQRNVWAFDIGEDRLLTNKRLVKQFPDHGFDGMRCDVDGNLYITRYGEGTVVKMSPDGEILQKIPVLGNRPSNLCFGGPDGCTVYVTQVDHARLVQFRVDRPGRAWAERNSK